jgi:hypothetical protein
VPDLFVIGAMRSGTTTFCADLATHPRVFMPPAKEPWVLVRTNSTAAACRRYAHLYRDIAGTDALLLDGSTSYTMQPEYPSPAARAAEVSPGAQIVYLVRNPVQRAISHHRHLLAWRTTDEPRFDAALQDNGSLVDFGRYWWQLQPWLEAFGAEAVQVLIFEEYTAARTAVVADVAASLGLDPSGVRIDEDAVYNQSSDARAVPSFWRPVFESDVYWRIRRRVPEDVRRRISNRILPTATQPASRPSAEAARAIVDACREDADALATFLGRPGPLWDWDATLRAFA